MTDQQAVDAFKRVARLEGIVPALETAHAFAYVFDGPKEPNTVDVICSLAAATRISRRCSPVTSATTNAGAARIEQAISGAPGAAALMPYVMGRVPPRMRSRSRSPAPAWRGGADLIELGIPTATRSLMVR